MHPLNEESMNKECALSLYAFVSYDIYKVISIRFSSFSSNDD